MSKEDIVTIFQNIYPTQTKAYITSFKKSLCDLNKSIMKIVAIEYKEKPMLSACIDYEFLVSMECVSSL